jgi:hypothetical protein
MVFQIGTWTFCSANLANNMVIKSFFFFAATLFTKSFPYVTSFSAANKDDIEFRRCPAKPVGRGRWCGHTKDVWSARIQFTLSLENCLAFGALTEAAYRECK